MRYELSKIVKNQSGDIVEFGVFFGTGLINFLQIDELLTPHNYTSRIFGFDTFNGLDGSESDFDVLKKGDYKYTNLPHLNEIINLQENYKRTPMKKIELIVGDVKLTLPKFLKEELSFLPKLIYLDLDLYSTTKFVLDSLQPYMRKGCVIVFDELGMPEFKGETQAFINHEVSKMGTLQKFDFAKISYIQIGI